MQKSNFVANTFKKYYSDRDYEQIDLFRLIRQFDLMISQYGGFVSEICKEYLKVGGILLVNNSHGDAGLASIDKDYILIAVVQKIKGRYRISESSLEQYFLPKKDIKITRELLFEVQKGFGYTKTAPLYIFRRIG